VFERQMPRKLRSSRWLKPCPKDIVLEVTRKDNRSELRSMHVALVPTIERFGGCSGACSFCIYENSHSLITAGKGRPPERVKELQKRRLYDEGLESK